MALYAPKAIPFGTMTSTSAPFIVSRAMRLRGFSMTNTSSSATAELDVYDGAGSGGILIAAVTLAANESTREYWPGDGIGIEQGVAVVWVSGSVKGSIYVIAPYGVEQSDTAPAV